MPSHASKSVSELLSDWAHGDRAALDQLIPLVYGELRRLAHRYLRKERAGHSLQTSALVNEAFIRLVQQHQPHYQDRAHFLAIAATLMRRILVDHARRKGYAKRGPNAEKVSLDERLLLFHKQAADVIAVDEALKELDALDRRKGRIVELRFFAGLSIEETAAALAISTATVEREWRTARAWLHRAMVPASRS
jgi:RNA polymerase sigma-70 factor (ECF subfamily)